MEEAHMEILIFAVGFATGYAIGWSLRLCVG